MFDSEAPTGPAIEAQIKALPTSPGVYSFYDAAGRLLYVGKSVNVRTRVRSYFRPGGGHSRRTERLKDEAARIAVEPCGTELEALLVESQAIKRLQPLYNVMGRTYKHYPFIKIPDERFPRVQLTYQLEDDGARYYGPFPSEYRAREALEAMRPLFRWRSCQPLESRECLEASIGRCSAPCVGRTSETAYMQAIAEDGFAYGQAILDVATPEGVWLDYKRKDPLTGEIEPKTSWLRRHDGYIFGCGIYVPTD